MVGQSVLGNAPGRIRDTAPVWFRIARMLPAKRWATYGWLERRGVLADAAPVRHHDGQVFMPMHEHACWHFADLGQVDALSTDNLAAIVRERFDAWTMVDCGANCGLFTLNLAHKAPGLERVIAVEPNLAYGCVLKRNMALLPGIAAFVHRGAVSDYSGRGRLVAPEYDPSPHAWFIRPDAEGDIDVMRIDDICPGDGNFVIKLDIEGGEPAALRGARGLLGRARDFVLFVEFHADVLARTGQTSRDMFDMVGAIRPTRWFDAEAPEHEIDLDRPVLEQTLNGRICDVIGVPG